MSDAKTWQEVTGFDTPEALHLYLSGMTILEADEVAARVLDTVQRKRDDALKALKAMVDHDSAGGPCDQPNYRCNCYENAEAVLATAERRCLSCGVTSGQHRFSCAAAGAYAAVLPANKENLGEDV